MAAWSISPWSIPAMLIPRGTVGVGSPATNPTAGPPWLWSPIELDMERHASTVVTYEVSSRKRAAARRISARLRSRGTSGEARTSETTSCIMCRLSKMIAISGYRSAKVGATAAVIGIRYGMVSGAFSSICQKRATVPRTSACRSSGVSPSISGSYSPTWSQWYAQISPLNFGKRSRKASE